MIGLIPLLNTRGAKPSNVSISSSPPLTYVYEFPTAGNGYRLQVSCKGAGAGGGKTTGRGTDGSNTEWILPSATWGSIENFIGGQGGERDGSDGVGAGGTSNVTGGGSPGGAGPGGAGSVNGGDGGWALRIYTVAEVQGILAILETVDAELRYVTLHVGAGGAGASGGAAGTDGVLELTWLDP